MRLFIASLGLCLLFLGSSTLTTWAQCSPDTENPVISGMPNNIVLSADVGNCGATATWTVPTATDNCALMSFVGTASPGAYFAVGNTLVTYTAVDQSGNLSASSFLISVTDDEDPSFDDVPGDITQAADPGACSTAVFWPALSPVDNCGIASTSSSHTSGDSFSFGTTTVTYSTTDVNGRTASTSFNVVVTATDTDSDGICDAEDTDDDNDGVADGDDDDSTDPTVCEDSDNDGCDDCSIGVDGFGPLADNTPANDGTDSDGDGFCDGGDNCSNTAACNYADPANSACLLLDGVCETCSDGTGTGTIVDNDADDDGTCDSLDECPNDPNKALAGICGCGVVDTDNDNDGLCDSDGSDNCYNTSACNYADVGNAACIIPTGCETCTNNDGTGGVNANDDDADGTCNSADGCPNDAAKIAPGTCGCGNVDVDVDNDGLCDSDGSDICFNTNACNYADVSNAACITPSGCETCTNNDGTGGTDANDDDADSTCNSADGCPNDPAKTEPGICGCGNLDVDADNDGLCDTDASDNCFDTSACNYAETSNAACITPTGCETCANNDGTGDVIVLDSDGDGECDGTDLCSDTNACNYADPSNAACITATGCETCTNNDGTGGTNANDSDSDGVCDTSDLCSDTNACNYADPSNAACITATGCETCTNNNGTGGTNANDSDSDGVCDSSDLCSDLSACNYAEVSNVACVNPTGCESCANSDGTGGVVVSDSDGDSICNGNDNCSDTNACNYADPSNAACITATGCETCTNNNGTGGTNANDSDSDGVCDGSDLCSDTNACNYADPSNAACIFPAPNSCETCTNIDGTGGVDANDDDSDGTCNADDLCPNDAAKTAPGICGCGNVDTDADSDGLCDTDASDNCYDTSACNYADASNAACISPAPSSCETCTNTDGTGGVDANDDDADSTCNDNDGCPNDPLKIAPGICGCGNVDTDIDNDGVCDDNDLCTDPLANNYQSAGGEECVPCPDAPVFEGIDIESFATTLSSADGDIALNISNSDADTLFLFGQNGAANLTIELPSDLDNIPAGYYTAMVMDSEGCIGVAQLSPGGSTLQQPGISRPLIVPYALCCNGCGINDIDSDGICDDSDNCTDQSACNFANECNEACVYPDGNGDCPANGDCNSGLRLISPQGDVYDFDPVTSTFSDPGASIPSGVTEFIEYNGGYLLSYGGGAGGGIQPTDSDMNSAGAVNEPNPWGVFNGIGDMNGTLVSVILAGSNSGNLVSIDPTTAGYSIIGMVGSGPKGGVEYDPGSNLIYAVTSGGNPSTLHHIDPFSGSITNSMPVSPATVLGSLRYSGGIFYAGGENGGLYTLNPSTGVLTSVGTMPSGAMISGIAKKQN